MAKSPAVVGGFKYLNIVYIVSKKFIHIKFMSLYITHNWGMLLRAEHKQTELQERIFSFVYCFCGLVALSAAI